MTTTHENQYDYTERLTPTQKIIATERLTYLPNLYYRQYKLIENLSQLRIDFPQHKVLIPREPTRHDHLLSQCRENQFILFEELKYKKVRNFQTSKAMKKQSTKIAIKKQEKYLFQRVTYSYLAEAVREKFHKAEPIQKQIPEEKRDMHPEKKREVQGIFVDESKSQQSDNIEDDLFMDILKDEEKNQLKNEEIQVAQKEVVIESVSKHINEIVNLEDQYEDFKPIHRKQCLKRINQNLRKRIKSKTTTEDSLERNLSSATVSITNLIGSEPEPKSSEEVVQIQSNIDSIFQTENKQKKKKEEGFDLKWAEEELEKFQQLNGKVDIGKEKFDSNYLLLEMEKNDGQFEKCFEKNIKGKKNFPPSLRQLPSLSAKFQQKYYYNELTDPEYEEFMMKYNKKNVMEKFIKAAPYIFSDSYSSDYEASNSVNIAKMFLSQDALQSDRMIYKINSRKMVPTSSLQQKSIFSEDQLYQLSFLVRKYLGLFGNNWKLICSFVNTHPAFSQMNLTLEQIQEYHQIARQKSDKNGQILRLWNSRVLPFKVYNSSIYEEYAPESNRDFIFDEDTYEKMENEQEQQKEIDLSQFEKMINEPLNQEQDEKNYSFSKTQQIFEKFAENVQISDVVGDKFTLSEHTRQMLNIFTSHDEPVKANFSKAEKSKWAHESVLQNLANEKSQIKIAYPFRKRKNISQKTSELVRILQMLKNKFGGASMHKQNPTNPQKPGTSSLQPASSVPTKTQEVKKQDVKTKPAIATGNKVEKQQPPSAEKKATNTSKSSGARHKKKKEEDK